MATEEPELRVYWQPGCSSCLRTKEYLRKQGVPFVSVNVNADERGYRELATLGLRTVPIVARGSEWVSGQVLGDVARIAGIEETRTALPPDRLKDRIIGILDGTIRFSAQLPEERLDEMVPGRPRSYRDLASHIFQIVDAFVDESEGKPLTEDAYMRPAPEHVRSPADLVAQGEATKARFAAWWEAHQSDDLSRPAQVYYGAQTLHDFMERTAWHAGQHARQLMLVLEKLGIAPDRPLTATDFAGLPMPERIYDDETVWE